MHCGPHTTHVLRDTLTEVVKKLDPQKFIRVHRSTVVNIDRIKEMHPWFNGKYKIIMKTDAAVTMSRTYHEKFMQVFGTPL